MMRTTRQANKARSQRKLVVSELRSPLSVLKDHLTFAEMESGISERRWAVIRHQVGNMETMIREMARMEQTVAQRATSLKTG